MSTLTVDRPTTRQWWETDEHEHLIDLDDCAFRLEWRVNVARSSLDWWVYPLDGGRYDNSIYGSVHGERIVVHEVKAIPEHFRALALAFDYEPLLEHVREVRDWQLANPKWAGLVPGPPAGWGGRRHGE
jgi:hypothetical protein